MIFNHILIFVFVRTVLSLNNENIDLAAEYFKIMNVNNVIIGTCKGNDFEIGLMKNFSFKRFQSSVLFFGKESWLEKNFLGSHNLGILLQADCAHTTALLNLATEKKLFNEQNSWLIVYSKPINQSEIENSFRSSAPPMFDIEEYFRIEVQEMAHRDRMAVINMEVNKKILEELEVEIQKNVTETSELTEEMKPLTELEAIIDSKVLLSFPSATHNGLDIYSIYRKTNHSPMQLEVISVDKALNLDKLHVTTAVRRKDFNGTVLRAACGLLYYEYFNRSDELTVIPFDQWAQMTFTHLKLIEENLNFRMLIKCFDDYGWPENGVFNGLVGFMQRHHAEITATGALLRNDRMNVMDYVDGTFEFKLGLLFRQPNLASVTNIFVLPFSRTVWLSLVALITLCVLTIWLQIKVGTWLHRELDVVNFGDILSFLSGVVCQQGYSLGNETVAVRVTILVILVTSLFLFTSYTATIVALLQSPAFLINSIEDFSKSSLTIGIEDLPYERKFVEEDDHEVMQEIRSRKISPLGEKAYINTSAGIQNVRKGMFGFQCELSNGYKIISETYEEHEKCGLKKLDLFPNRILGPAVTKKSPYKEVLAGRMRWIREIGLTKRTVDRWSFLKPTCVSASSGFSSVGIVDIFPLILVLAYGIFSSVIILLLEKYLYKKNVFKRVAKINKIIRKPIVKNRAVLFKKSKPSLWQYQN